MFDGVILQFFQWYDPWGGVLWDQLRTDATAIARDGFSALWIPPCYKGSGGEWDVGYGVYDLFDLGEFPQKQTTRTKYGSRAQLLAALSAARAAGLQVYADVVFNHKDGGDYTEDVLAQEVGLGRPQPHDRRPVHDQDVDEFPLPRPRRWRSSTTTTPSRASRWSRGWSRGSSRWRTRWCCCGATGTRACSTATITRSRATSTRAAR